MSERLIRLSWVTGLLASLVVIGCDPPPTGRDGGKASPAGEERRHASLTEKSVGQGTLVVRKTGQIDIFDRYGELRAEIVDSEADFLTTLTPLSGAAEWSKPHPDVTVGLPGLSDALTRRAREHRVHARLEAAGNTESLRQLTAIVQTAENIEVQLAALEEQLGEIWAEASKPEAARRRLLFNLWDECEEAAVPQPVVRVERAAEAADKLRAQAGERARHTIERFVATHLPAGSPHAYRPDELEQLNRGRKSRRAFAPYVD